MNLLTFQFPRGAGTIGVQVPVRADGLRKVQQLFGDVALQEQDFQLAGLSVKMHLTSTALANHFDLEPDAVFECWLNIKALAQQTHQITATVFEVGYDSNAVTSLPLHCTITAEGEVLNNTLI